MKSYAFFDVDETLIYSKSMFDFLYFWYEKQNNLDEYFRQLKIIKKKASQGASRTEINIFYYTQFKNTLLKDLISAGVEWFNIRLSAGGFFKYSITQELNKLKGNLIEPVFVSGSMIPVLQPIADKLGVTHILCTELKCHNDRLTGEIMSPTIGEFKRARIEKFIEINGRRDLNYYAFGDHISDLPMLEYVKYPIAVDPCDELLKIALSKGWRIIKS